MAYNSNVINDYKTDINRPNNLIWILDNLNCDKSLYKYLNRDCTIVLNFLPCLFIPQNINDVNLVKEDLFKYLINHVITKNHNLSQIYFLLYDYVDMSKDSFYMTPEIDSDSSGNITYKINKDKLNSELVIDKYGTKLQFFRINSEYKYNSIKENFKIIDKVMNELGIDYKIIYEPNPYLPEYIKDNKNFNSYNIKSPLVYGMNTTDFEINYKHAFKLNSDIVKDIDTISCKDEIQWLSSKYYEDIYYIKSIISNINPIIQFGLGIDYYMTFGNYSSDTLLQLDKDKYSNFQEQVLFNENFVYPFADFLFIDNLNYDYRIIQSSDSTDIHRIDIRTFNERIELVAKKFNYPLNKTHIRLSYFNDTKDTSSFIRNLLNNYSNFKNSHSFNYNMFDEYLYRNENNKNGSLNENNITDMTEYKSSILEYLEKIHLDIKDCNRVNFNENTYNGNLLIPNLTLDI